MIERLVFENEGSLDINFVKMMGVSVKEDSAIGMFGTGLKYAIATILRHGGSILIFTNGNEYVFSTKTIELRDKEFQQIYINNEPLPFTTELGINWLPWMAIRELYSNALDEKGSMNLISFIPDGFYKDKTYIFVTGECFVEVFHERHRYFITENQVPLYRTRDVEVHPQISCCERTIFYKGIAIFSPELPTLFKYNLKSEVKLTEDRTIYNEFEAQSYLMKSVVESKDKDFIRTCLTSPNCFYESKFDFIMYGVTPSEEFCEVCETLIAQQPRDLNKAAIKFYDKIRSRIREYVEVGITPKQQKQIDRSLNCLRKMGYQTEIDKFPIKVTNSLGSTILGQALNGTIWLSTNIFDLGTKYICSTIFEEFVHLKYGYHDHTREMQTWLFDKVITMAEDFVMQEAL